MQSLTLLAAASLVLGVGAQVAAQTAPAIVECTWNGGGVETYRVGATTWETWDVASWSWRERACSDIIDVKCTISNSASQILWKMYGKEFIDGGKSAWTLTIVDTSINIDRLTGLATYSRHYRFESPRTAPKLTRQDMTATCQGAKDPALLAKPAPPTPKF